MQDNGDYSIIESNYIVVDTSNINRFIAFKNLLRYLLYNYDFETNLYYLNSRYYDLETGRFINADDISILSEGKDFINGLNLYTYCGNNPIMNTDEYGNKWWDWLFGIVVTVATVALSVLTFGVGTAITASLGGSLLASILGGAVGGAISSAVMSAGVFIGIQSINNGVGNIDWSNVGIATLIGA